MNNPLVSICCITFNHGRFIKQCLEGFLTQQVNFNIEILIYDDASTDETGKILKEYQKLHPKVIFPVIATSNQYSKGIRGINLRFNFPRARGKYIAMCEGDDFWTDSLKLQKQIDVFKRDPSLTLSCHGWKVIDESGRVIREKEPSDFPLGHTKQVIFGLKEFSTQWITKSLSIMFPLQALDLIEIQKYRAPVDKHLFYTLLKSGKGVFINEVMGVYRVHRGGVVSLISIEKKIDTIRRIAKDIFQNNSNEPYARKMYFRALQRQINYNINQSGYFGSIRENMPHVRELNKMTKNIREYKHLILAFTPRQIIKFVKQLKEFGNKR